MMNIRLRYILRCCYFWMADAFSVLGRGSQVESLKSLVIVHTDAIGDYILFRNFIRTIKESLMYEGYAITLIGNSAYKNIALELDSEVVDDFIWFNRNQFQFDKKYRSHFLKQLSAKKYEVAINPSYSRDFVFGDSIIRALRATHKIGQVGDIANTYGLLLRISDSWYSKLIDTGAEVQFEFYRNQKFASVVLGLTLDHALPTMKLPTINNRELEAYIVLFPGAGEKQKQWSVQHFAACANAVLVKSNINVLICGSDVDYVLGEQIQILCSGHQNRVKNICGETTLIELSHLIKQSKLLLTNDSSALHIAAATNTPAICVGNGRHFGRFTPYPETIAKSLRFVFPPLIQEMAFNNLGLLKVRTIQKTIVSIEEVSEESVLLAMQELGIVK